MAGMVVHSSQYQQHLLSAAWNVTKAFAMIRAGGRCEGPDCGSTQYLQGHHRSYRRMGRIDEVLDVVILCRKCHLGGVHADKATSKVDPDQPGLFGVPA